MFSWVDAIATRGRRPTLIALAVALAAGALWVLAAPPLDLWPLAWLAPAPLLWLIDRAPSNKRARRYAWLVGTVISAGGFHWITELLSRYSSFPGVLSWLALLAFAAFQGLQLWAFGWAVRRLRQISRERLGAPLPMALVAPVTIVCFETVWPQIFPFNLAITQAWVTPVIQIAELVGPVGVTALLFAAGGALYDLLTEVERRRRLIPVGASAVAIAASLVYGFVRIHQLDDARAVAPTLEVGLVQTNVPFDGAAARDDDAQVARLRDTQDATAKLQADGAKLVVWPESGFPYVMERGLVPGPADRIVRHHPWTATGLEPEPTFTVPLIFSALTGNRGDERPPHNSALFEVGSDYVGRYDKNYLVMFSEHIPGADTFSWLAHALPRGSGNLSAGHEVVAFPFEADGATWNLVPLICFEDTLPAFTHRAADLHPNLLVNLTNDTWFGASEPWQHLALAVFRSVELRTDMVRAVNTGVTSHIDAAGRVRSTSEVIDPANDPHPPEGHLVTVALLDGGRGLFARTGNIFGFLCVVAVGLLWLVWPRVRRRRKKQRPARSRALTANGNGRERDGEVMVQVE